MVAVTVSLCLSSNGFVLIVEKARDGSQPSSLQNALWEESMRRAKESMFQRVKDLEVIQSLVRSFSPR